MQIYYTLLLVASAAFLAGFLPAYLYSALLKHLIAAVIALYGLLALCGINLQVKTSSSLLVLGGVVSAILSAVTGIGGMLRAAFLSAYIYCYACVDRMRYRFCADRGISRIRSIIKR